MNLSNLKRLVLLGLVGLAGVIANNCAESGGPMPRNLIRGIVIDSLSSEPIDSAQIVIGDTLAPERVFFSDSTGQFQAYPDTSGLAQVFCMKTGYVTKMTIVDLTKNKDIYDNVDFELIPE